MSQRNPHLSIYALAVVQVFVWPVLLSTLAFAQSESVIYSFKGGSDGIHPYGGLIADQDGNLYGTTSEGGGPGQGSGTVFELSPNGNGWTETVIHAFQGTDGCYPVQGLVMDAAGNLYGAASCGGAYGSGVVFELQRLAGGQWNEITLHNFYFDGQSHFDGSNPSSPLIFDSAGNIYGTTEFGGVGQCTDNENNARPPKFVPPAGCGTVFELSPNSDGTWTETILYTFKYGTSGGLPVSGLVMDSGGNLYGTATNGGAYDYGFCGSFYDYGTGVVFALSRGADGAWTESVIHSFNGYSDGGEPSGTLIFDQAGNLYGTTAGCGGDWYANSTAFELSPSSDGSWSLATIHAFNYRANGYSPWGGLTFDTAGNLYGTTYQSFSGANAYPYYGVVFKLTEANGEWNESVLHTFENPPDGAFPGYDGLLLQNGVLYGTTSKGGDYNFGAVFAVTP